MIKEIRHNVANALAILSGIALGIGGPAIHIITFVVAYKFWGLGGAMLALFLPVVAEIFWFIKVWHHTGTIANFYCIVILAYIGFIALVRVAVVIYGRE